MLKTRFDSWVDGVSGEAATLDPQQSPHRLIAAFWATAYVIAAYFLFQSFGIDEPLVRLLGAAPVAIMAMLPSYLWCANRVRGVPIFPLFALSYLWTYALPLVSQHPAIMRYDSIAILAVGLIVAVFLMLTTAVWYLIARSPAPVFRTEKLLKDAGGRVFFIVIIVTAGSLSMAMTGGWMRIEAGVYSIIRAVLSALATVGLFALSYKWGKRELPLLQRLVFIGAFAFYLITQMVTLFLVGAIIAASLVIVGYTTGRRRFPWVWVLVVVTVFGFFHIGKGAMREQYWGPDPQPVEIWNYPGFFAEWLDHGVEEFNATDSIAPPQPIYERVSLAHLLLKVQDESPEPVPYLLGATYAIIPGLLMPRFLSPEKLTAVNSTKQ